jgi:GMP synthase (glutamine-hydrolysing)
MQHNVLILDFGSHIHSLLYGSELNIFCEIFPYNHFPSDLSSYKAVILEVALSLRGEDAPHPDLSQISVTHACSIYGAQYLAHFSGGEVAAPILEYGRANLSYIKENEALKVFQ